MPISPLEIMRGSILCHEGKVKKVKAVSELILFEDVKAWIGGSMVEAEPLTEHWIELMGFTKDGERYYWADPKSSRIIWLKPYEATKSWLVEYSVNDISNAPLRVVRSVHQLQFVFFGIMEEHIILPKIKK